jgi:hypothetical protein
MAEFVLLYRGGSAGETEAEQAAQMQAWTAWFGTLGDAVVNGGNPFTETAAHVRTDGSVGSVPAAGIATGFSILQADSLDHATTLAKGCPVLQSGGEIEIYEQFDVM